MINAIEAATSAQQSVAGGQPTIELVTDATVTSSCDPCWPPLCDPNRGCPPNCMPCNPECSPEYCGPACRPEKGGPF
jgi:hypothetical protein